MFEYMYSMSLLCTSLTKKFGRVKTQTHKKPSFPHGQQNSAATSGVCQAPICSNQGLPTTGENKHQYLNQKFQNPVRLRGKSNSRCRIQVLLPFWTMFSQLIFSQPDLHN